MSLFAELMRTAAPRPPGFAVPWGQLYKIGLPGKLILRYYFQENRSSRRPFLLLRISFPGRPIFIQLVPGVEERVDVFGPEEVHVVPPVVGDRVVVKQVGQLREGALVVLF